MSKRGYGAAFGRAVGAVGGMLQGSSFSYNPTTRNTVTYAGGGSAGGVKFSRERHLVGKRKRSNTIKKSDLFKGMSVIRGRWQLSSKTLTGPGRVPISFGGYSTTDANHHVMPVHFMSLTQCPYNGAALVDHAKGCDRFGLYRVIRNHTNGKFGYQPYQCNTSVGVNSYDVFGRWQAEQKNNGVDFDQPDQYSSLYHKWTEVRLNLYGAKHIPLVYTINIVQMPKEFSPFQHAPDGSVGGITTGQDEFNQFSRWMEDINRSLLCNPINVTGTDKEYKKHVKIVKQYKINMQPLSYTNAAAEGTAPVKVGNVRQFKIFMRHDRWRQYAWAETAINVVQDRDFSDLGWDMKQDENPVTDVSWNKRLYMFITCTTGAITDGLQNNLTTGYPYQLEDIPSDYGTYDIIVRNEFLEPSGVSGA